MHSLTIQSIFSPHTLSSSKIKWGEYAFLIFLFTIAKLAIYIPINLYMLHVVKFELSIQITLEEATSADFVLAAVVFAPILEELIFRLPLLLTGTNLAVSLTILVYIFTSRHFVGDIYAPVVANLAILLGLGVLSLALYRIRFYTILTTELKKRYSLFFYILPFAFGLLHLLKYNDVPVLVWLMGPVITSPHILMAFVASYFRLKYGMRYSILFHAINNSIPILVLFAYKALS